MKLPYHKRIPLLIFALSLILFDAKVMGEPDQSCSDKLIKNYIDVLRESEDETLLDVSSRALINCKSKSIEPLVEVILSNTSYSQGSLTYTISEIGESEPIVVSLLIKALESNNAEARDSAARTLGRIGKEAKDAIPALINALQDKDAEVRDRVAVALGYVSVDTNVAVPALIQALQDKDHSVRASAAVSLGEIGVHAKDSIPALITIAQSDQYFMARAYAIESLGYIRGESSELIPTLVGALSDEKGTVRCLSAYSIGRLGQKSDEVVKALIKALDDEDSEVCQGSVFALGRIGAGKYSNEVISILLNVLKDDTRDNSIRLEAASSLGIIGLQLQNNQDLFSLNELDEIIFNFQEALELIESRQDIFTEKHIADMQAYISILSRERQIRWIIPFIRQGSLIWLGHSLLWLGLIFAYPKSSHVQAIFFWNPFIRKFFGAGYVGFALTWIPPLRRKLFEPFRQSLLADAALEVFSEKTYFQYSEVKLKSTLDVHPTSTTILKFKGQIVIEGVSGLGKSMLLKYLCSKSNRVVVYLPAIKCSEGVIEAIQRKLHGEEIKDPRFLQNLIYSGAIAICIDGLNEVSADTRAKIVEFTENYFKGDIILATQPMEWTAPSTAKIYIIQPLKREQIQDFLVSRQPLIPDYAPVKDEEYVQECEKFIYQALGSSDNAYANETKASQQILSNPMDLTVIASMLASGENPDLLHLQEQQYNVMAEEYKGKNLGIEFPLKTFSEEVYQMRLNDISAFPENKFSKEIYCLERHKMVVSRQSLDTEENSVKEWYFRHDKIADFFILQAFLSSPERQKDNLGDPRFQGVYFLLANFLDLEDAKTLREMLIQYAADTKDHTVSDAFIQLLRSRNTEF